MAATGHTVTIDRAYFETLLRKASFGNGEYTTNVPPPPGAQDVTVVSKADHEQLLSIARQYASLRANLMNGGVDENTIDLLSQDDTSLRMQHLAVQSASSIPPHEKADCSGSDGAIALKPQISWKSGPRQTSLETDRNGYDHYNNASANKSVKCRSDWADGDDDNFSTPHSFDAQTTRAAQNLSPDQFSQPQRSSNKPYYARMCKRTITLAGIPEGTTYEDITNVVRGGMLLEIYIKAHEHSALVSFLLEKDAVRFYEYSRENDLYINHKRIFIKWADRQFHLPGHVAGKISQGATRNMVIRRCDPKHTEDSVRDDLEHIHNLVVIKIEFLGGSCYIKTNSVHNAMFARTCMMSRAKYKGSRIDWDTDECEQPLESARKLSLPRPSPPRSSSPKYQHVSPMKKPVVKVRNRFAGLRLDDDDDMSDEEFYSSTEFAPASTVDVTA
ncbi:uncharacterized protein JN550_011779 [Neoarthrinium moseri]|uniref:uncharacterized protein n=1 Tax=Neoarthrinium moseri TaxID=1658444 RepID=UPI001FDBF76C|nr:uncharacterized protein JN550_011779 [Neoarthrinium moseri]KAI1859968.1 hypothetical protein JN550_011779 [Neoarthrinium moseri]